MKSERDSTSAFFPRLLIKPQHCIWRHQSALLTLFTTQTHTEDWNQASQGRNERFSVSKIVRRRVCSRRSTLFFLQLSFSRQWILRVWAAEKPHGRALRRSWEWKIRKLKFSSTFSSFASYVFVRVVRSQLCVFGLRQKFNLGKRKFLENFFFLHFHTFSCALAKSFCLGR